MRYAVVSILISITYPSWGAERPDSTVTQVHTKDNVVDPQGEVRLLGKLNVNTATREQLLQIPALDPLKIDQLIEARTRGALTSLSVFDLSDEAINRLSLTGPSTLRRIRQLPLEIFTATNTAAR